MIYNDMWRFLRKNPGLELVLKFERTNGGVYVASLRKNGFTQVPSSGGKHTLMEAVDDLFDRVRSLGEVR